VSTTAETLKELTNALSESGGEIEAAIIATEGIDLYYAAQLSGAPKIGNDSRYLVAVEAIYEGYLLHYGKSRLLSLAGQDIQLLAGDYLYALGLNYLATTENIAAVCSFSELIMACAQAQASSQLQRAEALWEVTISELGWGISKQLEAAKKALEADEFASSVLLAQSVRDGV